MSPGKLVLGTIHRGEQSASWFKVVECDKQPCLYLPRFGRMGNGQLRVLWFLKSKEGKLLDKQDFKNISSFSYRSSQGEGKGST